MASYEVQTDGGTYQVDTDDTVQPEKTLGGFAKNLGNDAMQTLKQPSAPDPREGQLNSPKQALEDLKGTFSPLVDEAKRLGGDELLKGNFSEAGNKLGNAFYDKPLTSALDFAPLFGGEAMGEASEAAEAPKTPTLAEEVPKASAPDVSRVAPTSQAPLNLPPEAADILKEKPVPPQASAPSPTPSVPNPSALGDLADKIKGAIPKAVVDPMQEVNKYLQAQYGKRAADPGAIQTMVKYLRQHAQNMTLKDLGASPMQVKSMGADPARAIAQTAMDKGVSGPTVGTIGMKEKMNSIQNAAGQQIGALRKIADTRGTPPSIEDVTNAVKAKLEDKYTKGIESDQNSKYQFALNQLKNAQPTHQGLADLATDLHGKATKATKLKEDPGALVDVANEVSRINNASVHQMLNPKEQAAYDAALKDYGATNKMQQFFARKESREAGGRMGPGGGIRHVMQDFLDQFGYKAQARIASKMADTIGKNPGIAKDLPSLFKEFIHQVHDLGDDADVIH